MPEYFERARLFRERAEKLRKIAADLGSSRDRRVLEQAAQEYEDMAKAEAAKSTVDRR
jgi:hypothetical protein